LAVCLIRAATGNLQCRHAAGHAAFSTSSSSRKHKGKGSRNSTTATSSGSGDGTAAATIPVQVGGAIDLKLPNLLNETGLDVIQQGIDQWVKQHQQMAENPFQKGQVLDNGRCALALITPCAVPGVLVAVQQGIESSNQQLAASSWQNTLSRR
jgi:hypothetical protein